MVKKEEEDRIWSQIWLEAEGEERRCLLKMTDFSYNREESNVGGKCGRGPD